MKDKFSRLEDFHPWRLYFGLLVILIGLCAIGSTILPAGRIYQARVTNAAHKKAIQKSDRQKLAHDTQQIQSFSNQWQTLKKTQIDSKAFFTNTLTTDGRIQAQMLKARVIDLKTAANQLSDDLVGRETLLNSIQQLLTDMARFIS